MLWIMFDIEIQKQKKNLPGPDIEDEKDEDDSLDFFMEEKDCWISPPPWTPVENDIPLEEL